jgi:CTP:molybdopterin cytidylyltransferase MocA
MAISSPFASVRKTVIENSIDSMLISALSGCVVVTGVQAEELEAVICSRYLGETVLCTRIGILHRRYARFDKNRIEAMPECDAFFLLPGDMPIISKETYLAVYRAIPENGDLPSYSQHCTDSASIRR